jgi:UDP-3-O-[3-hydroxymyristoyl] glucosamine N-acyltransferase
MSYITSNYFKLATGIEINFDFECTNIGMLNSKLSNTFSFLEEEKYLALATKNDNISVILVPEIFNHSLEGRKLIKVKDPKKYFYLFFDYLQQFKIKNKTQISSSAIISKSAIISPYNVKIGERTNIGHNVVIKEDVYIGNDINIASGTIIGEEGLELKNIDNKKIRILHDKSVFIENNVNIGSNCVIDKGIYRDTIISQNTNIDSLVHIAHACQIKSNVIIGSGSILLGSVSIGENVWVGPNSTISNGIDIERDSFIALGSVVIENVKANSKISGNFATSHMVNLFKYKKNKNGE